MELKKYFDPYIATLFAVVAVGFLYLQLGPNEQDVIPEINRYGIEISVANDGYGRLHEVRVTRVAGCGHSPEIQVGDKITAVNNISVKNPVDVNKKYRKEQKNNKALEPYFSASEDLDIYVERPIHGMVQSWKYRLTLNPDPKKRYPCKKKLSISGSSAAPKGGLFLLYVSIV
jgi:hypothetical protein